jgi:hypothetical protein
VGLIFRIHYREGEIFEEIDKEMQVDPLLIIHQVDIGLVKMMIGVLLLLILLLTFTLYFDSK